MVKLVKLFVVLAFLSTVAYGQEGGKFITFNTSEHDFGTLEEFSPPLSYTFRFLNASGSAVELAAPGLKKEDFNVNIDRDGNLHIHMESKAEHKDEDKKSHYLRREFSYSKYEQTLLLPDDVDKDRIEAKVNDGVLTVNLPKVEKLPEKTMKQIEVK